MNELSQFHGERKDRSVNCGLSSFFLELSVSCFGILDCGEKAQGNQLTAYSVEEPDALRTDAYVDLCPDTESQVTEYDVSMEKIAGMTVSIAWKI